MKNTAKFSLIFVTILTFFGCTTEKNTLVTRTYHNTTARYNIYFNGTESYKIGVSSIKDNYLDNFNEILPVFLYSDDDQLKTASGDMETALTKCAKAITNHSITVKPKIKNSDEITEKDKQFYEKNEYCKWIDDAYLLMGKSNFYTQEYTRAMRSFRLIISQYKLENTRYDAMLWLAKTYIEQEKYTDAESTLNELENDVRHPEKLDLEINLTYADFYLRQEQYDDAIEYLEKGIEQTKNKRTRARYIYILAQIYEEIQDFNKASDLYKKVIKMNPPYELAFNAKIKRATVSDLGAGEISEVKKQLIKLLKDEKNIDFKDQIYYALANIEMKEGNTEDAIEYYKLSAQLSVSNNIQKSISYLALADIYFAVPDYLPAGAYYDSTMQFLDNDYYDYEAISLKAENLSELVGYLKEVQLQDSLQMLANMSEMERLAVIDKIIADITKAEEEASVKESGTYTDPIDNIEISGGSWYFYNPTAVSLGITEFKKKWGDRKLEDDWRRRNKAMILDDEIIDDAIADDSTRITDNKTREFYLQDIPLTDSMIEVSDNKIIEALFSTGDIYYKKMEDYEEAIFTYEDLIDRYPDNKYLLECYYALYNINLLLKQNSKSEYYKNQIVNFFPDSKYAKMILNPYYIDELAEIEQEANQLYETTLSYYKSGDYSLVIENEEIARETFPDSETLSKFLFLKALSHGKLKNIDSLSAILTQFIEEYPNDLAVEVATGILATIESGKYNMEIYSDEPEMPHIYVIAFKTKSFELNTIKFKLTVISGDYSIDTEYKIESSEFDENYTILTIKTFENKEDAIGFYDEVITSFTFSDLSPDDYEHFVISESNYNVFIIDKYIEKYLTFFTNNYL